MSTLVLIRGLASLTVLFPAGLVLLAQPKIGRGTRVGLGARHPALLKWHGRTGWIALSGLLLAGMFFPLTGPQPGLAQEPRYLMHVILCMVCAVAVLGKVWINHQTGKRKKGQVLSWVMAIITLGASFTCLTCVLIAWRWTDSTATWDASRCFIYQAAMLGHVALGISLIWLGRTALKVPHSHSVA